MNKIALIPSYEPDMVLCNLVNELYDNNYSIVVVDDGSGSKFNNIFDLIQTKAIVIRYEENQGKGYALKKGLSYIYEQYRNSIIVTMDSDGQHTVYDANRICNEANEHKDTLIIGSRDLDKDIPVRSKIGNSITRKVFQIVSGTYIYDTQSGLRGFSCDLIPILLNIDGNRYEYEMNVLLTFAKNKYLMKEIKIETIYFDKKNSVSHFKTGRDSFLIYSEILKFTGSSLLSFGIDYWFYILFVNIFNKTSIYLILCNFMARAISSVFNFTVNKKIVFKSDGNIMKEAFHYFSLVLFIICVNSIFLIGLTHLGINAYISKIIVEMLMFIVSYSVQHTFIFKKEMKIL